MYQHIKVPTKGEKITVNADMSLTVPDMPIIPYIEGDGTGMDITPVMLKVVDAAVAKAYGGKREIQWMEVYAGEKATNIYGKSSGWKFMLARRRPTSTAPMCGCPPKRLMRSVTTWSRSKAL